MAAARVRARDSTALGGGQVSGGRRRLSPPSRPESGRLKGSKLERCPLAGSLTRPAPVRAHPYFIVGMTNSAPARMPVGQRVVMVFSFV